MLANLADAHPARFVDGVAGILALAPIPDREPDARARLDSLPAQARDGRLSPADFAYVRAGCLPGVAKVYEQRLSKLGAVQQVWLLDRRGLGDDRIHTYELKYVTDVLLMTMGIAPDGKVSQFRIGSK